MKTYTRLTCVLGLFTLPTLAAAFGNEGHKTVGAIASEMIKGSRAETEIQTILADGETLSRAATWPDRAKSKDSPDPEIRAYRKRNRDHHDYHYTDVPFALSEYQFDAVGTTDHDIVVTLRQCIEVLRGKTGSAVNPHSFRKREALRLLVHLVGDIHQPLHVGSAYVNDEDEFFEPAKMAEVDGDSGFDTKGALYLLLDDNSFHSYWDNEAVADARDSVGAESSSAFVNALIGNGLEPLPGTGDVVTWPQQWADETLVVAKIAFGDVEIDERIDPSDSDESGAVNWTITVPNGYDDKAAAIASEQIKLAGRRLATVLKAIWPES